MKVAICLVLEIMSPEIAMPLPAVWLDEDEGASTMRRVSHLVVLVVKLLEATYATLL